MLGTINTSGDSGGETTSQVYDQVIRTQADFTKLTNSSTWLDAKSVCFVGNGGTAVFKSTKSQILIPINVVRIDAINKAIIEISTYSPQNYQIPAFGYATLPVDDNYCINGLSVIVNGDVNDAYTIAISNCRNLTNCVAVAHSNVYSTSSSFGVAVGFENCENLINCTGNGKRISDAIWSGSAISFRYCNNLVNCKMTDTMTKNTYVFRYCSGLIGCSVEISESQSDTVGYLDCDTLTNCDATISGFSANGGFTRCKKLTNCNSNINTRSVYNSTGAYKESSQLVNCTGSLICTSGGGYSFCDCSYLNGCKQGSVASTTGFLGGTNTKVDAITVAAV